MRDRILDLGWRVALESLKDLGWDVKIPPFINESLVGDSSAPITIPIEDG